MPRTRPDRILRLPEVMTRAGVSPATLYRLLGCGLFPRPCQVGKHIVGWRESAVNRWIRELPDAPPRPPVRKPRERTVVA